MNKTVSLSLAKPDYDTKLDFSSHSQPSMDSRSDGEIIQPVQGQEVEIGKELQEGKKRIKQSAAELGEYVSGLIEDGYNSFPVKAMRRMAKGFSDGVHWIQAYGCWVKVEGKALFCLRAEANGEPEMFNGKENWGEIIAPENQMFLDAVNAVLGTNFRYKQFAMRARAI